MLLVLPCTPSLSACPLLQADAMTDEERETFRKHVASELGAASVECGHNVMYQFSPEELDAAGKP